MVLEKCSKNLLLGRRELEYLGSTISLSQNSSSVAILGNIFKAEEHTHRHRNDGIYSMEQVTIPAGHKQSIRVLEKAGQVILEPLSGSCKIANGLADSEDGILTVEASDFGDHDRTIVIGENWIRLRR